MSKRNKIISLFSIIIIIVSLVYIYNTSNLVSDKEAYFIVTDNLDRMQREIFKIIEKPMAMSEMPSQNPDVAKEVESKRVDIEEAFKPYVSDDFLTEWSEAYTNKYMESRQSLELTSDDIHSRFNVFDKRRNSFKFSFITLSDDGWQGHNSPYTEMTYVRKNGNWLLKDVKVDNMENESLNASIHDLKNMYRVRNGALVSLKYIENFKYNGEDFIACQDMNRPEQDIISLAIDSGWVSLDLYREYKASNN